MTQCVEKNQKYPVQPRRLPVSAEDPYEHDQLNRRETGEILTRLVSNIEGPCVIALDAGWGAGKTTFLRMWTESVRNEFPVVMFNAWETDFSGNPFLSLSEELLETLQSMGSEDVDKLRSAAKEVIRRSFSNLPSVSAALLELIPGGGAIKAGSDVVKAINESLSEDGLSQYGERKKAIREFKEILKQSAAKLSELHEGQPLLIVIDELDRCRPSYAVELLETAKHLFDIDGITFVLALNRPEMEHSVRAIYGTGFDSERYLRRFFDIDFRLPDADRKAFVEEQLRNSNIIPYLGEIRDEVKQVVHGWLTEFSNSPLFDLRTVQQSLRRLGVVLAVAKIGNVGFLEEAVFAVILRAVNHDMYRRLRIGNATDKEIFNALFSVTPETFGITNPSDGGRFWLETQIITIARGMQIENKKADIRTPLFDDLRSISENGYKEESYMDRTFASCIVESCKEGFRANKKIRDFLSAVEMLELVSPELLGERISS